MGLFSGIGNAFKGVASKIGGSFSDAVSGGVGDFVSAGFGAGTDAVFGKGPDYESQQKAIRWRVADAKAAGVHPLFALGASIGASPPITGGSSYGPSAGSRSPQVDQDLRAAQLEQVRAQTRQANAAAAADFALAQARASEVKRNEVVSNVRQDLQFVVPRPRRKPEVLGTSHPRHALLPSGHVISLPRGLTGQEGEDLFSDIGGNIVGLHYGLATILENLGVDPAWIDWPVYNTRQERPKPRRKFPR